MTTNRAFRQLVRARMKETGEKYTVARRRIIEEEMNRRCNNCDEGLIMISGSYVCPACEVDF